MNYLKNHCWCSDSNWGGSFNCQIIVGLSSYEEGYTEDWASTIDEKADQFIKEDLFFACAKERYAERGLIDEFNPNDFARDVLNLKPEVLQWLNDNVQDLSVDRFGNEHLKAWAVGSTEYRATNGCGMSVFFIRRKDAMAFINRWSKWKKPIHYCQYFTDVRKTLDLSTLRYTSK